MGNDMFSLSIYQFELGGDYYYYYEQQKNSKSSLNSHCQQIPIYVEIQKGIICLIIVSLGAEAEISSPGRQS